MTTSISVPAAKLRDMLDAVMPHAGTDDTLPVLMTVRFEVLAGALWLAATDRYTMGVARYVIPGAGDAQVQDATAALMPGEARVMREALDGAADVAALTFGDDLRMDAGTGWRGTWENAGTAKTAKLYPEWRPLLARMLAARDAAFAPALGLDPEYLPRFAALDDPAWSAEEDGETFRRCTEPLVMRAVNIGEHGCASTLLVARGDWFLGAVMLMRNDAPAAPKGGPWQQWTAALPAQPVPASAA
jgi:hypothetical protein